MIARSWIVAALSLTTLTAWSPSSAPTTRRYKVDVKTLQVVNLTAIGQTEQRVEIASTGFVTITTTDSAGGQAVTIVLDSLQVAPGAPIPADAAKAAAGATWHGFRPASGRVKGLKLEGDNPVASTVAGILQEIFPPLKAGTKEGATWTDTTDTDTGNSGILVRTVTNFQTSNDTYNGAKVLRLAGASSSAISGTQEGPQGSMSFEGTGSGTITWLVGSDGFSLGSTYSSKQSLSITAAVSPEPLPVEITTEGTVTLLK
jgi:hypothetical protein